MLVGYARDSGSGQSLELQLRALSDAGCAKMFSEQKSGTPAGAQHALQRAMDFLLRGDTLVVTQLDRLARSPNDIHGIIASLAGSGISFRCLQQSRVETGRDKETSSGAFLERFLPSLEPTPDGRARAIG